VRAALAGSALVLPLLAAADSQTASGAGRAALRAAAHVDFKIVIPRMLSLDLAALERPGAPRDAVAVYSTGHDVLLGAGAAPAYRAGLILSSAARKGIAEVARCAAVPGAHAPLVCTASTP